MKNKLICFLQIALITFLTAFVLSCTTSPPPAISVSTEDVAIEAVTNKTAWDDGEEPDSESFITILSACKRDELPFVAVDEEITIQFFSGLPDSILLNEYIIFIDEEGVVTAEEVKELEYRIKRKKAYFNIEPLSSQPFAEDEVLRGYKVICRFAKGNECEYLFIIRSTVM